MAQSSYPFDGQATTESQFSQFFRQLQDTGVASSASATDLKVSADSSGMNVAVQPGFAIVRGHAYLSTAAETVTIPAADSSARIDIVVLRLDPTANSITLEVVKGTAGAGAPSLTQTDTDTYEFALASVAVGANVTTISPANVTDLRRFTGQRLGVWANDSRPTDPKLGRLGLNTNTSQWEWWNGAAWVALAPVVNWTNIDGKPVTFAPAAHTHLWADLTDKPTTFPPSAHTHAWADITGEPGFAPASHTHTWSSITSKPSTFPPSSHSHGQYLESGDTISWANGSKKPHNNSASGSGTWYAVWVEGNGTFCRNTSSIRFKENVRDYGVNPDDVLALRPVIYDRKDQVDDDGTVKLGRKDEVGLIAEEVEPHLPWLVNYLDGEVDGLRYDLLGVALIPVVQRQQARIDELESRLARIEAQLGVTE
ncbi:minor tail protein [Streptomyces phage VieEnRose]|nr:minor tail protein [Streptomyces phage VieEnRose]